MPMRIPTARAAALLAVLAERERQDRLHGFDATRPLGTGGPLGEMLERVLRELYEAAKAAGNLTWAHTLLEEVGEVLGATAAEDVRKELRQVAALCLKVEEALVASGALPDVADEDVPALSHTLTSLVGDGTAERLADGMADALLLLNSARPAEAANALEAALEETRPGQPTESPGDAALRAFAEYSASLPRAERTAADLQALLGAHELAVRAGASPAALVLVEDPAELGRAIAHLKEGVH